MYASPALASDGRALKFRPAPADNGPAGVLRGPPERPNMRVVPPRPPTLPVLLLSGLLLAPLQVAAQADDPRDPDHRGWSYLVDKLVADGLDRSRVTLVFDDPHLPPFDGLEFSAAPRESHALYRGFQRPASIAAARRCRAAHADVLEAAEHGSGVPANVVAAILYVETACGRNTGSSMILHRLARLAMANEPANLGDNLERQGGAGECDTSLEERLRARARYLEDTFYPEVRAAFDVADRLGVHPLSLRGSASGAIGTPQFLPTNYLRFGTDGDRDGRVDLFDLGDAAASCARYLSANGWRPGLAEKERRAVIWRYNHSDAYIDTVLTLARRIGDGGTPAAPPRKAPRPTHSPAKRGNRARS